MGLVSLIGRVVRAVEEGILVLLRATRWLIDRIL